MDDGDGSSPSTRTDQEPVHFRTPDGNDDATVRRKRNKGEKHSRQGGMGRRIQSEESEIVST